MNNYPFNRSQYTFAIAIICMRLDVSTVERGREADGIAVVLLGSSAEIRLMALPPKFQNRVISRFQARPGLL